MSKHQDELNIIKIRERNNKSAGCNASMAICQNAVTKEQFPVARCQNAMRKVQIAMFQWQNVRM